MFKKFAIAAAFVSMGLLTVSDNAFARKTIRNCSASCSGATVGCCATSTGKCKYRSSTSNSWEHGETENGSCVVNGKVVGKVPTFTKAKRQKEKQKLTPENN